MHTFVVSTLTRPPCACFFVRLSMLHSDDSRSSRALSDSKLLIYTNKPHAFSGVTRNRSKVWKSAIQSSEELMEKREWQKNNLHNYIASPTCCSGTTAGVAEQGECPHFDLAAKEQYEQIHQERVHQQKGFDSCQHFSSDSIHTHCICARAIWESSKKEQQGLKERCTGAAQRLRTHANTKKRVEGAKDPVSLPFRLEHWPEAANPWHWK